MTSPDLDPEADPLNSHSPSDKTSNASLLQLCASLHTKVALFLDLQTDDDRIRRTQAQTRSSLEVIHEALKTYSLSELSLSYNGGKDCLVLLILFLSVLPSLPPSRVPPLLSSVYILPPSPFPEVASFVAQTTSLYHLDLAHYSLPMREAFAAYLADHPKIRAIMVGTRRTDPHGGKLSSFDRTDRGWPDFMRVHPVLEWHYAEIWTFLRLLEIPYCVLYDLGYTSLGGTEDTHPNPALRQDVGDGGEKRGGQRGSFRPAYELADGEKERLGRDR